MHHIRPISNSRPAPAQLDGVMQLVLVIQTLVFLPLNVAGQLLSFGQTFASIGGQIISNGQMFTSWLGMKDAQA